MNYLREYIKALYLTLGYVGGTYLLVSVFRNVDPIVAIYLVYYCIFMSIGGPFSYYFNKEKK